MIAAGFAQNGAKVYIAARKERQLKEVSSLQRKQQVRVKCFAVGRQWMTSTSQPFKKCSTLLQMLGYVISTTISNCLSLVKSKAGCDALIAEFRKRENKLHVLINNSGISWGAPFKDFPEERGWDNVFNVNVKSIFYCECSKYDDRSSGMVNFYQ